MDIENMKSALRRQLQAGSPVLGVSAGIGLTAKCAAKAGADLIFINNAGRFRTAGRSTLLSKFSFGNANETMLQMVGEILPVIGDTPAIAGVFAQDPFRSIDLLLEQLQRLGVAGIQNSPTLGMMKPAMAKNLEAGMLGFSKEIEMIGKAHRMGFFTAPMIHQPEQAEAFAAAGADLIVATVGVTIGADDPAQTPDLDENIASIRAMTEAAKGANPELLVLCHGGALSTPEAVQCALDAIPALDGFVGGSAVERIPVEQAIARIIRDFKQAGSVCKEEMP